MFYAQSTGAVISGRQIQRKNEANKYSSNSKETENIFILLLPFMWLSVSTWMQNVFTLLSKNTVEKLQWLERSVGKLILISVMSFPPHSYAADHCKWRTKEFFERFRPWKPFSVYFHNLKVTRETTLIKNLGRLNILFKKLIFATQWPFCIFCIFHP